ncbi:MAG TPA: MFS transporter [Xanthobacteraceae bacterium]|jgi:MFS family permease|nr:MFS transporter [Xanthobacteraceae bacterium]
MSSTAASHNPHDAEKRLAIGFLNWAHAIDHFVLGIYPTVVIGLEIVYRRPYSELIALATAMFVAFGVFSLPAGWLADRWSRRNMMVAFFIGCGVALAAAAFAPNLPVLAAALFGLGMFAAIYHPVGMAMLIEISQARGRTLAFNGVCGNLGVALAAGVTGILASWFGWRAAFIVPAVLCIATGIAYLWLVAGDTHQIAARKKTAEVALSPRAALVMFMLFIVISIMSGLVFNTVLVALPKLVDEQLGDSVDLMVVGGLATAVFMCGALAQLAVGRLVERMSAPMLFAAVVTVQFFGILLAAHATGPMLLLALALAMAAIYGQVTVGDIVVARFTADAWRGRIYAVRYFLNFTSSAIAVGMIALLHDRGGFALVLAVIAGCAGIVVVTVYGFAALAHTVETRSRALPQPAE